MPFSKISLNKSQSLVEKILDFSPSRAASEFVENSSSIGNKNLSNKNKLKNQIFISNTVIRTFDIPQKKLTT